MVKLRTLGECVIEVGDARIAPDSKIIFAFLLFLGLERGKRFTRAALMDMFWPGSPPANAAHSLRQTIYQCRKLGVGIQATKTEVALPDDVTSDLDDLGDTVQNATGQSHEFLPSYDASFSSSYRAWIERQRDTAMARLRWQFILNIKDRRARGDWQTVGSTARALLELDPLNEEATLALAEATALSGNKVGAIHLLDQFTKDVGSESPLLLPARVLRRRIAEYGGDRSSTSTFFGRSEALEFLHLQMRHARKGEGQALLFWGEPGIGKSRLVAEFQKSAALQSLQVIKVECQAADAMRPFSAIIEAIPDLCQLRGALGCSPSSLVLLQQLTRHRPNDAQEELDKPPVEANGAPRLRSAVCELIDAILTETPIALVVEDVHWLDTVSWQMLAQLAAGCSSRRLLILLTSRPEYARNEPSEGCERIVRYAIPPLTDRDARSLFHSVSSGTQTLGKNEEDWFIRVAEGNPYFVQELARHFSDTHRTYHIPPSLGTLLSQRIRKVGPHSLRLLQVCALLGRQSTFGRIERVLQTEALTLLDALEELEVAELVESEGTRITPRHALLSEQAVLLCTPAAKRLLHKRIADVLESEVLASNSAALLWTCADHLRSAGEASRAIRLVHSSAEHLTKLGLATEAIAVLEQALDLSNDQDERLETLNYLSVAYRAAKNWAKAAATLRDASLSRIALHLSANHHDDELRLIEAEWFAEASEYGGGSWPRYISKLLSCIRALDSSPLHRLDAARFALVIADNVAAVREMDEIYEAVRSLLTNESLPVQSRLWVRAVYETGRGDLGEGVAAARYLIEYYRSSGNVWELGKMLHNSCIPLRYSGFFEEAERNVREAIAIAEERSLWMMYTDALDTLGAMQLNSDRLADAKVSQAAAAAKLSPDSPSAQAVSIRRLRVLIAIAEGDFNLAARIHSPTEKELTYPIARYRDEAIATDIIIRNALRHEIRQEHVDALMASHMRGKDGGRFDFNAVGLVLGLRNLGRSQEALSMWTDYINIHRRERSPIPLYLQRVLGLSSR